MSAPTVQVIDGDGEFQEDALKTWVNDTGVAGSQANYQVVAIMGPQSSGKSTLMNHLVRGACMANSAMIGGACAPHGAAGAAREKAEARAQRMLHARCVGAARRGRLVVLALLLPTLRWQCGASFRRRCTAEAEPARTGRHRQRRAWRTVSLKWRSLPSCLRACICSSSAGAPCITPARGHPCPHEHGAAAQQLHAPPPQFGTTFVEMDAMAGRRQTTKGVWLAK